MKGLLVSTILLLLAVAAFAQQPYHYAITPEQGLPSREVYRIVQNDDGYLWIGCNAGIFRYDGIEFRPYRNAQQAGRSISNLALDGKGGLWCGNFSGQIFSVAEDSLHIFTDWSKREAQFPILCPDADGLWLTSDSGLFHLPWQGDPTPFFLPESERQHTDNIFVSSKNEVFCYGHFNGFFRLDRKSGRLRRLAIPESLRSFAEGQTHFIEVFGKVLALWQRKSDGMAQWVEILPDRIEPFQGLSSQGIHSKVNRICTTDTLSVWVCTNAGAVHIAPEGTRTYLSSMRVSDVIRDREGSHWFTTLDNGVVVMPNLNIRHYGAEFLGERQANITALTRGADGSLLLGHFDGSVRKFYLREERLESMLERTEGLHHTTEQIVDIGGDLQVARGSFTIKTAQGVIEIPQGGNAKSFVTMNDDTLFIGTVQGLSKLYRLSSGGWERSLLRSGMCRKLMFGSPPARELWAIFKDGVFHGSADALVPLLHHGKPVFAADISAFSDGTVWIATITNGLLEVRDGAVVKVWDTASGLGSNDLFAVATDSDRLLWIAHANGLDLFANGKFQHFGLLNGMPLKEVNDLLVMDGHVFLAAHNGLTVVKANAESFNRTPPKLMLNEALLRDSLIPLQGEAVFGHRFNELKVSMSVLAFRGRGNCKVRYRLSGLDSTWSEQAGNRIEVVYNALPAGSFVFEAFALNEDGVSSAETVRFSFTVKLPFWQTWWFYLLCALSIVALVVAFYSWRIRRIRERAALKHEAVSSRLTALKAQMNPHFLFNALNSIQELILQKDVVNGLKYLGKFGSLTRQILETSGQEQVTLQAEVYMLSNYLELEKLRFGDSFSYTLDISTDIDPEGLMLPPMLIQPYVENALKHGLLHRQTDRRLSITFCMEGEMLHVTVTDNGIGRKAASAIAQRQSGHRSFSTSATAKRLELMITQSGAHGRVEIMDLMENGVALGTEVHLRIPSITA